MKRYKKVDREDRYLFLARSLITGFIGGLLWGGTWIIMYYFNFSEITPKTFILRSWITSEWTNEWWGSGATVLLMGIISILIALIYYFVLKRINSMWIGVIYGIVLWIIFFYLLEPLFPNLQRLTNLNKNTIISTLCLFLLYGTFIGYSISYDYYDTHVKSNKGG